MNRRLYTRLVLAIFAAAYAATVPAFATPVQVPTTFGQIPLAFEQNSGQTEARFQFLARGADHSVYLAPNEAVVALAKTAPASASSRVTGVRLSPPVAPHFLRFALLGARAEAVGRGQSTLPGRIHRLAGSRPDRWTTNIAAFARVQFDAVYPGIDLVYHGNQNQIEYDFVVAPGADPSVISWQIEGAREIVIDARGDLVIATGDRTFRQHRPVVYQMIDGARREIHGRFVLRGRAQVGFVLGAYDRTVPLVIDPVLSLDYSTYLGGAKVDRAWCVAADTAGNVYVAGDTLGVFKDVPATGFQTNSGGGTKYGGDAFVMKLDPTGTNFVYFTYLGGNSLDVANGLALDSTGAAYVTGFTTSTNFPVVQANQPVNASALLREFESYFADAYVTKLDANGLPVYSTYLGGELDDVAGAIAVDPSGSAYVTGYTESSQIYRATYFVTTTRCTNTTIFTNEVVTLTNSVLVTNQLVLTNTTCGVPAPAVTNVFNERQPQAIRWTTNLVRRITRRAPPLTINEIVDINEFVLQTHERIAVGFPTVNAFQTNNAGGTIEYEAAFPDGTNEVFTTGADMFVTKLSPDGLSLAYSTYLGGEFSREFGSGIGVDGDGNAIVCGDTDADGFPVTNAFQALFAGGRDGVVAKLDPSGASLVYATYLGGSFTDIAHDVAVDPPGNAYLVGSTASPDFLVTPGGVRPGGVFKSVDGSGNWTPASAGLTHTGVRALAINPASPSILFAATPRGLYLSTDGAETWTISSPDLATRDFTAVGIDPAAPGTVYAAGPEIFSRSEDSGSVWTMLESGLPLTTISSLLFDPANSSLLYAGTRVGFYASTNRGTNFVRIGSGMKNRTIHVLAMDPANSATLYAGTEGGVFHSTNAGLDWRAMNTGLGTRRVLALALNPSAPTTLVAGTSKGIYRSTDSGTNWVIATNGIGRTQINAVQYDPGDSAVIYAGATNGVFRSADGGVTWSNASAGLTARDVIALAVDPTDPSILYAGTRGTNFSGGTNDAFLVKLSPTGTTLEYGFTFGGNRTDEARGVAVDAEGSAFVTGFTLSRNFPVNSAVDRWRSTNSGRADAFVAQFDPTGSSNVFSIHLGGKRNDTAHDVALDGLGGIYVVGATDSKDFVVTNAIKSVRSGEKQDAFVTKLFLPAPPPAIISPPLLPPVFPFNPIIVTPR